MNTVKPEGQDLLDGLYRVKYYLDLVNNKFSEFVNLEREYRSNIAHIAHNKKISHIEKLEIVSTKDKSQYGLFTVGISFAVITAITSLFSGDFAMVLFCLFITALFVRGKTKNNKKFLIAGGLLIILTLVSFVQSQIDNFKYYHSIGNDGALIVSTVLNLVGFVIGIIVSAFLFKKYNTGIDVKNKDIDIRNLEIDKENQRIDEHNKKIDLENQRIAEHNLAVYNKRQSISEEINKINGEMIDETESWYPVDYYSLDVVEQFISTVRNHRADTVKEMMTVFDTNNFRQELLQSQYSINDKLEQSLNNQQQMIKLQKISNVLLMGSAIANLVTASNTASIANSARQTAMNTSNMAESARQTAEKTASIARNAEAMARKVGGSFF